MLAQHLDKLDGAPTEPSDPTLSFRRSSPPIATPRNATYELIWHIGRGNIPQNEIPRVLSEIFDSRDYKRSIEQLPGNDLEMWVERLDQVYRFLFSLG